MSKYPINVVIVGAGAAGLFAADRLNRAGLSFLILEADMHAGGRVQSRSNAGADLGLVIDDGANLINSTDTLAIGLLNRFNIAYVRRLQLGADHMHYVFDGSHLNQAAMARLLFEQGRPALERLYQDQGEWERSPDRDVNAKFIGDSIAGYLKQIGASRLLTRLMHSFFWSEYGRVLEELNLHVLFDYLQIDLENRSFALIPNADEAFTVPGGTAQISDALEASCHPHIKYGRRVVRISDRRLDHVCIECHNQMGESETYLAQTVLFAAPLYSLQDIEVDVAGVTRESLARARAVSYARGTKLHLKFRRGFHSRYKFSGIVVTDSGEQIWPSDTGQHGGGLLTVLTGPMPMETGATARRVSHLLEIIDIVAPGSAAFFVDADRSDAPMSYSGSLRPGEVAALAINRGGERWMTIGEASGGELQGYLEGAFRSAEIATTRLILQLRKSRGSNSHE